MSKLPFTPRGQCHQDAMAYRIIVEGMGVQNPTALEIGTNHPIERNNTYELERLGWNCLLADSDDYCVKLTREMRKSPIIHNDATVVDWLPHIQNWFGSSHVDYLSLDVDQATLATLKKLPLDKITFGFLNCEHDSYRFGKGPRDQMRAILLNAGYQFVCLDVMDNGCEFEDWAVGPSINLSAYEKFLALDPTDWKEIVNR